VSSLFATSAYIFFITGKNHDYPSISIDTIVLKCQRRGGALPQLLVRSKDETDYIHTAIEPILNLLYVWSSDGKYECLRQWRIETVDNVWKLVPHHRHNFRAVSWPFPLNDLGLT
jgi:hypothetical protein